LVGAARLNLVAASGGKVVLTNRPVAISRDDPPQAVVF